MTADRNNRPGLLFAIFVVVFLVHLYSPVCQNGDSHWVIHTAASLFNEHNLNLDEYAGLIDSSDTRVERIDGHLYSIFPIGTPILASPILAILHFFSLRVLQYNLMDEFRSAEASGVLEVFIASLVVALAAVLIYAAIVRSGRSSLTAMVAVFVFAFCSPAWSTASRALWQHGPSILMLSTAMYLLIRAEELPCFTQWVSLPLAFAYVIRPTNSIAVAAVTVFVFYRHRRWFVRYLLWLLPVAVPFVVYNISTYHAILSPYYLAGRLGGHGHVLEALPGNLISPSRGIFVFSPVFLIAVARMVSTTRKRRWESLDLLFGLIVVLHWIAISVFPHWWGGASYGPRFFADMVPFLVFLLMPGLEEILRSESHFAGLRRAVFLVMLAFSFFTNMNGAVFKGTLSWNNAPAAIDKAPERIWDWKDPQFLRLRASYPDSTGRYSTVGLR